MTVNTPTRTPFPTRGTLGGWVDAWDDPIDCEAIRAEEEAAERDLDRRSEATRVALLEDRGRLLG